MKKKKKAEICKYSFAIPHQRWLSWNTHLVADVKKAYEHIAQYYK